MRRFWAIIFMLPIFLLFNGTSLEASEAVYIVKSGDSLWKISSQQGISVKEIKELNNLTSDSLKIGQSCYLREAAESRRRYIRARELYSPGGR